MQDRSKDLRTDRRKKFLGSLEFEQIESRRLTIKEAHEKTCRWFLSHPSYKAWLGASQLKQHHGFLWVSGKPGAGKSTLMKFVHSTMAAKHSGYQVIASFFFNARGESLEKSVSGMYRSLLLQLLEGYPDLQHVLDDPELMANVWSQGPAPQQVVDDPKLKPTSSSQECYRLSLDILKNIFRAAIMKLGSPSPASSTLLMNAMNSKQLRWYTSSKSLPYNLLILECPFVSVFLVAITRILR